VTASGIPQAAGGLPPCGPRAVDTRQAVLSPAALLHSGGGSAPVHRAPRNTFPGYRIAQSVQGSSPRFHSGLSLLCMHAALRPRRFSKHGCLKVGTRHSIAFCTFTSSAPSNHRMPTALPHAHVVPASPRSPAQRACSKNLNGLGPRPIKSTWATCRNRALTRLGWPNQPATRRSSCRA
jgi:hypothetical protein